MPSLKAIHLVGSPTLIKRRDATGDGVVSDVPYAEPVLPELQRFIGKPLRLADITEIGRIISVSYVARHHPYVATFAPPQDISSGVLQILVEEYRLGEVKVIGTRWFPAGRTRRQLRIDRGETIDARALVRSLAVINANPFRHVEAVFTPGTAPGTTDLDLVAHDRVPLQPYVGYSNDGSAATGFDRWKMGLNFGNLFGTGLQVGYQFTTSSDFWSARRRANGSRDPGFVAHAGSLGYTLDDGKRIELFGDVETDHPDFGPDLGSTGHSAQASARLVLPLPSTGRLVHELSLGYDFKTTNNNLQFGGVQVSAQSAEIDQFPILYRGTLPDRLGRTIFSNLLVLSPGGLTGGNHTANFQPSASGSGVVRANARYAYDRVALERDIALPKGFTWVLRGEAQIASTNLLPSEQFNIGGMETVRGYHEYVAGGSDGVLGSVAIRAPAIPLLSRLAALQGTGDALQAELFFDYGHVRDVHAIPDLPRSTDLMSTGASFTYQLGRFVRVGASAGVPLRDLPATGRRHVFTNVSVTIGF